MFHLVRLSDWQLFEPLKLFTGWKIEWIFREAKCLLSGVSESISRYWADRHLGMVDVTVVVSPRGFSPESFNPAAETFKCHILVHASYTRRYIYGGIFIAIFRYTLICTGLRPESRHTARTAPRTGGQPKWSLYVDERTLCVNVPTAWLSPLAILIW